ncbi:MAG: response regulator [Chitinophagaceae bacterium]
MYNVLIADDDVDAWFQVNSMLRRNSIKANFVNNLGAARQYVDHQAPSLLFFDKQLQDSYPVDFIKYVKGKYPSAKVVLIKHYGENNINMGCNADLTISKPLMPDTIERSIKQLLPQQQEVQRPMPL